MWTSVVPGKWSFPWNLPWIWYGPAAGAVQRTIEYSPAQPGCRFNTSGGTVTVSEFTGLPVVLCATAGGILLQLPRYHWSSPDGEFTSQVEYKTNGPPNTNA